MKKHRNSLHGKTVFITGAARGIGAAVARAAYREGAKVALIGLEPERLQALASELGDRAIAIEADVVSRSAMQVAAKETLTKLGPVDVLIANAGILQVGSLAEGSAVGIDRTLSVNLNGVLHSLQAVLPQVIEQRGYVLNVASLAALVNGPAMGAYAISKAAVDAMSNSLRVELAPRGVTVGCAYFGAIDTDLVQGSRKHPAMERLEQLSPKFLGAEIPVEKAAEAIIRGIERRSTRVFAPDWIRWVYRLRGVLQPVFEARFQNDPRITEIQMLADSPAAAAQAEGNLLGTAANVISIASGSSSETKSDAHETQHSKQAES